MNQAEATIENLKKLDAIARQDTPMFFMAIANVFSNGVDYYQEMPKDTMLRHVEEKHKRDKAAGKIPIMTESFEKTLVEMCYEIAAFPLFDILLYIKKHMDIHDPEAAGHQLEDEE